MNICLVLRIVTIACCVSISSSDMHMRRLIRDMLQSGYNKHARPRHSLTESKTFVKMGLSLESIVDVDMKNQILTTHLWLETEWRDRTLRWDPVNYGGIDRMHVPPDDIWKPDIVLYNSADGNFTVKAKYKVIIHHTGRLIWRPPTIFKSLCEIDVTYFPYDTQNCNLKLGSWTHDSNAVDIHHKSLSLANRSNLVLIENGIDLDVYGASTEWDLLNVSAKKFEPVYPCCDFTFPDIKFFITVRRKPLFYMVNLIIPCIAICSVTVLVFYIPAMSAEKVTLGITVLNSLTVFLLLVVEITPPTSFSTPLIGKYLVFTMSLVTFSIVVTVLVLNIHYGSPILREMPVWVRDTFLIVLPKILMVQPPKTPTTPGQWYDKKIKDTCGSKDDQGYSNQGYSGMKGFGDRRYAEYASLPKPIVQTMIGVSSIADTLKQSEEDKQKSNDWQYVALVIDRLFLYVFMAAGLLGTLGTFMQAPSHYDYRPGFEQRQTTLCNNEPGQGCWYQTHGP